MPDDTQSQTTTRVRILVAIDRNGKWTAAGARPTGRVQFHDRFLSLRPACPTAPACKGRLSPFRSLRSGPGGERSRGPPWSQKQPRPGEPCAGLSAGSKLYPVRNIPDFPRHAYGRKSRFLASCSAYDRSTASVYKTAALPLC